MTKNVHGKCQVSFIHPHIGIKILHARKVVVLLFVVKEPFFFHAWASMLACSIRSGLLFKMSSPWMKPYTNHSGNSTS